MTQFTLYVSAKDSSEIYPDNAAKGFTVQLPKILMLDGTWTCRVEKVQVNTSKFIHKPLALYSDFCSETYHYGVDRPVLLDFVLKSEGGWQEYRNYCTDSYVIIKNNTLRIISFELIGDTEDAVSDLRLQLHFKRELWRA